MIPKIGSLIYYYRNDTLTNIGIVIKQNEWGDFIVWWTESGWSKNTQIALTKYCEIYDP